MNKSTQLAGEAYRTRLARAEAATPADKTRIAQEGYKSRLARDAAARQPDTTEFYKVGEKIGGRYEVAAIHHGGQGVVYGCFDHQTKLPRALKTVRARHASDKQMLSLFESEATVWISLEKHPYIVRAYLVERFHNLPYVITEYVRGPEGMEGDLRGWLGHPRLTLPVAVAMALQIAQGMQHAVRKVPNLVHRDLKPANILVNGDGKAMVTDFGLVHAAQSGAGTPAYMSPEQWRSEVLDARTDIYAYGCILFEMFTAHRLFPAMTESEWERAHLESAPAALTSIVPELPGEIDQFVRRCLEKDPVARPRNWDEIVTFFADWYHRFTGKAVVLDFSSLALDAIERLEVGYSHWNLKRFEEAIQAFDRALAIDKLDATAWFMKGYVLGGLGRRDEAIQAYDRAIAIDGNDSITWTSKGDALTGLMRYDEALAAYDRALTLDPNSAIAEKNRAIALEFSILSEGAKVKGIVKFVNDFGAFVDLSGIDGVLHITDLAWHRVKHPTEVVNVGDEVTAKVLKIDREKNRVSLGLKQLGGDPWVGISHRYPQGTRLVGEVTNLTDYGPFVEVESGIDGLVHVSEMDWINKNVIPSKVVQLGDDVEVMILEIDEKRRRISLGMKQCTPNPWQEFSKNFKKGDKVKGEIKSITDLGILIDLPGMIDGLVHLSDLSWSKSAEEAVRQFKKGEEIEAMVLSIDVERESVSLGIKQCVHNPLDDFAREVKKGDALAEGKHYDEAVSAYEQALVLNPDDANAWFKKGNALLRLERYEEALSAYNHASPLDKNGGISYISGFTLQKLKRYEESIVACDRALAINPSLAIAQSTKAFSLQELKRHEVAPPVRRPQSFWARLWDR